MVTTHSQPAAKRLWHQDMTSDHSEDDRIDFVVLLLMLWRGKWVVLICVLISILTGGYYALYVAPSYFSSEAWIEMRSEDAQLIDIQSVVSGASADVESINTQIDIVKSREIIEQLISDMDLMDDPEFNTELQAKSAFFESGLRRIIYGIFGLDANEGQAANSEERRLSVVAAVQEAVTVAAKPTTYLFYISVRSTDANKSAEMANRIAEIYLEDQAQTKIEAKEYAVDWLTERVGELEREVSVKEDAITELRASTELINAETLDALNVRAKEIRQRLEDSKSLLLKLAETEQRLVSFLAERDYDQVVNLLNDDGLRRVLPNVKRGDTNALAEFSERIEVLRQNSRSTQGRVESQIAVMQRSFEELESEIDEQNQDLITLNQMMRDVEATKVLYETFLSRLKEISIQIGLLQTDSRIMSAAVPGRQVAPRKAAILAAAALLGFIVSVAALVLRARMKDGYRSPQEIEVQTGHAVIGQIPLIPERRRKSILEYLRNKKTSAAAEAVRNLRTSLLLSNGDTPPQLIMSTSSVPGEGKTTQSIALAQNLVALGKKVLLVEGDIRRRVLKEYYQGDSDGSLVSIIEGDHTLEQAVVVDEVDGFDVLLGGHTVTNAADVFSSRNFQVLLQEMRAEYDYVVIDTPPVLVVPDARIIGQLVDATMYSVKWNSTGRSEVMGGLNELLSVGVKVSGIVLSQVNLKSQSYYGYGGKYNAYSYGRYGGDYYMS